MIGYSEMIINRRTLLLALQEYIDKHYPATNLDEHLVVTDFVCPWSMMNDGASGCLLKMETPKQFVTGTP